MKKVLVTGGSGFIGSHIVDKLMEEGYETTVFDIAKPHRRDARFINSNVLDFKKLAAAMKGFDYVYHLAAVADVNDVNRDPLRAVRVNSEGTANVLEAARGNNVERVIFASSAWVYSGARCDEPDENSAFHPSDTTHIYTSAKIASEMYCHNYHKLYGQAFTILRYGTAYGPRMRESMVIPRFLKKALAGEPLTIFGDGSQRRNFVYVEDLADGNLAALKENAKNQVYNLVGGREISVVEIAETIKKILGREIKIEFGKQRPGDVQGNESSHEKAKRELGWEPKVDFEDGVKRTVEWYRANRRS